MNNEMPYIMKKVEYEEKVYNPKYGDSRICKCGHSYLGHFDGHDDGMLIGCEYDDCIAFVEKDSTKHPFVVDMQIENYNFTEDAYSYTVESLASSDLCSLIRSTECDLTIIQTGSDLFSVVCKK